MTSLWKRAFWKDAIERTISAMCQSLLLFLGGDGLGEVVPGVDISVDFSAWQTWLTVVGGAALIQMLKNFIAVTANPNSGASFGASIPGNLVRAYTTVVAQETEGYMGETIAEPGDTVSGPAPDGLKEGGLVQVTLLPPVERSGTP